MEYNAVGVKTCEIIRCSLRNAFTVAKYEAQGVAGFFRPRKARGATVLTAEVIAQAQVLLSQGSSRRQVAEQHMMEHFAIELLSEYQTEAIPGTNSPVVNPRWRELDRRYRSLRTKLQRRQAEFAAHTLHPVGIEPRGRRPFAGS